MKTAVSVATGFTLLLACFGMPADAAQDEQLEEVRVTGEQPGPAMWRVSKDDHELWIIGTLTPLPAKMTWRSKQAESAVRESQEILGAASVRADVSGSRWAIIRSIPALLRLQNNPDGATLKQVLPAETYARWSAMYQRISGKAPDEKDRSRPMFAANELFDMALRRSGLSNRNVVWPVLAKLAKDAKVSVRQREFTVPLKDPRGLIDEFAATPRDADIGCLVTMLDRIDKDLPDMRQRAEAWAVGDIATLRRLAPSFQRQAEASCVDSLLTGPRLHQMYEEQKKNVIDDFYNSVGYALLARKTSLTTLPIEYLLDEKGVLANLRRSGYQVEEPR
jgi:uncharacterized protein YbaP (TraB family)